MSARKKLAVVTEIHAYGRVAFNDVDPYLTEVVLSNYVRATLPFQPVWGWVSVLISSYGVDFPTIKIQGRTEGTRHHGRLTHQATVNLAEDEEGNLDHWPAYALAALAEVRKSVKL